jgi:hypothetical protein
MEKTQGHAMRNRLGLFSTIGRKKNAKLAFKGLQQRYKFRLYLTEKPSVK